MDFLSGDLDRVFTALYELGMIEPMLGKDWSKMYAQDHKVWKDVGGAIRKLNKMASLKEIRGFIETLPQRVVEALVIEVAREMAEFHERKEMVH
ncbi:MAG: hypothetical protein IPM57_01700 [Oligoflexia bacterium]|nr:hypothetical protein [Oligoflexia bacterium]